MAIRITTWGLVTTAGFWAVVLVSVCRLALALWLGLSF